MEIYGAVNLIDSALTRRVAGSFVRARMSDIKKLSAAQWPARFGFLQAMTRRECTARMRSRIIYLSYPWPHYATYCVTAERSRSSHVRSSSRYASSADTSLDVIA